MYDGNGNATVKMHNGNVTGKNEQEKRHEGFQCNFTK
jgi:hypothetical protein